MPFNLPQMFGGLLPNLQAQSAPQNADPSDGMMDMAMLVGRQTGQDPRDIYKTFVGGRAGSTNSDTNNPMLQPLSGSGLPKTNELSNLFPNHPRLGGALDNAALAMSMIPTGQTIGENIQGVSNAMQELPYARLAHQFQMMQPGLQAQQAQASIFEQIARGQMYAGRDPAQVEAARVRDQNEAEERLLSAQHTDIMPAESDDPQNNIKKGQPVEMHVSYYRDKNGDLQEKHTQSGRTSEDVFRYGGLNQSGATTRGNQGYNQSEFQQHINNYMALHPDADPNDPETMRGALNDWDASVAARSGKAAADKGNQPETKADIQKRQAAQRAQGDNEAYTNTMKDLDELSKLPPSKLRDVYPNESDASKRRQFQAQAPATRHQVDILNSTYRQQYPDNNYKGGFQQFIQDNGYNPKTRSFSNVGMSINVQQKEKTYNPATGAIE